MKTKSCLFSVGRVGLAIGAFALGTLLVPAAHGQVSVNIGVPQVNVTVAPDNYVYYPAYGVYYSPQRHLFGWVRNGAWSWRASPPNVSADVVLAAPSVKMDFHDSPEHHHADIVKKYPKDWNPHHNDQRDHHDEGRR
jgi:hypothetical protein